MCKIDNNAVVEKNVKIGKGSIVEYGCVIRGNVKIGENCHFYPYSIVGTPPQDLKYNGEDSFIEIGDNNVIREFVTIHSATGQGEKTIIGNNNYLMVSSHIAHNCIVGNNVILVNGAALGGHVVVEDNVFIGAYVAVQQHSRIGKMVIVGTNSKVSRDIPPYLMGNGNPLRIYGLNKVGLIRNNVSSEIRERIKRAYKILYKSDLMREEALKKIENEIEKCKEISHFVDFVRNSKIGIHR